MADAGGPPTPDQIGTMANFVGFHDEDFAQARYTAQGPFLRFSIKADQRTLKDIAGQR